MRFALIKTTLVIIVILIIAYAFNINIAGVIAQVITAIQKMHAASVNGGHPLWV